MSEFATTPRRGSTPTPISSPFSCLRALVDILGERGEGELDLDYTPETHAAIRHARWPRWRRSWVGQLLEEAGASAVPLLVERYLSDPRDDADLIAETLARIGPISVTPLRDALAESRDYEARLCIVEALYLVLGSRWRSATSGKSTSSSPS